MKKKKEKQKEQINATQICRKRKKESCTVVKKAPTVVKTKENPKWAPKNVKLKRTNYIQIIKYIYIKTRRIFKMFKILGMGR